jgi:hypothetical protein
MHSFEVVPRKQKTDASDMLLQKKYQIQFFDIKTVFLNTQKKSGSISSFTICSLYLSGLSLGVESVLSVLF